MGVSDKMEVMLLNMWYIAIDGPKDCVIKGVESVN